MCVYMCGGEVEMVHVCMCVCVRMKTNIFKVLSKYLILVSSLNQE